MTDRYLVALDASPRASLVLAAAAKLATQTGASLVLFRAVGVPPDLPHEIFELTDARLDEVLLRNARSDLEQIAAGLSIKAEHAAVLGTAWDAVVRAARDYQASLIVIGSHGYGGLDRILGTTAAKIVNHADRNVLVVRTPL